MINVLLARPLEPWYCREMSGVTEAIKPYNGKEVAIQGFIVPSLFRVRNARVEEVWGAKIFKVGEVPAPAFKAVGAAVKRVYARRRRTICGRRSIEAW